MVVVVLGGVVGMLMRSMGLGQPKAAPHPANTARSTVGADA